MKPWTPLSGAEIEDAFGPIGPRQKSGSGVRARRAAKRAQAKLQLENLELRAVPALAAIVVGTSLASTTGSNVTIGEVVRYRVAATIPFDNTQYASLDIHSLLPSGLVFVNDGTATMALVSNNGIISTIAPAGSDLYATGDETNLAGITPTFHVTPSILTGGRDLTFSAGALNVLDNDANHEYMLIEFNAVVVNFEGAAGNHAGDSLSSQFQLIVGGAPDPTSVGGADVNVVEPSLTNVSKSATAVTINNQPGVHYTLSFTNTGTSVAYDIRVRDFIPSGLIFNPASIQVTGGTGVSIGTTDTSFEVRFDQVAVGGVVSIEYDAVFDPNGVPGQQITNTANVDYTSLPGDNGENPNPTGSVTPGAPGAADGERDGSGGFNNYAGAASATVTSPGGAGTAAISGFVKCADMPGEPGINGVIVRLYDSNGNLVATTVTHTLAGTGDGYYEFNGLAPGTYTVVEDDSALPPGITDANQIMVGTINGVAVGTAGHDAQGNDFIGDITVNPLDVGVMYCFLDFCMPQQTAQVSGFVKCVDTPGEPGINGVIVRLYDMNGNLVATTTTHTLAGIGDGYYEFTGLAPGTYRVVEDDSALPPGITDADVVMVGTINGVTVGMGGQDAQGNDFIGGIVLNPGDVGVMYCFLDHCLPQTAQLSGFVKCIDTPGEPGINGVTVWLFDMNGNLVATTVTHTLAGIGDGYYEFTGLAPGTYRIVEDDQNLPPGITDANVIMVGTINGMTVGIPGQDAQGDDFIGGIIVHAGDVGVMYCFLEFCMPQTTQLSGNVFCDDNHNGQLEPGEHVFANIRIRLTGGSLGAPLFATTDLNGHYSFTNLASGAYQITLVDVPGSFMMNGQTVNVFNTLNAVPGTVNGITVGAGTISMINGVALPSGADSINNNFPLVCVGGLEAPIMLHGLVFFDTNHDCLLNAPNERGIAGVQIRAIAMDSAGNIVFDQMTTTNIDGEYWFLFNGAANGQTYTFKVTEMQPAGFVHEGEMPGNFGGVTSSHMISNILLNNSDRSNAVEYNFCEELPTPPPPPPSKRDFLANGVPGSGVGGTVDFGQVTSTPSFNNINIVPRPGVRYLVTGADVGGGPHVRVFDFISGREVFSFLAYDPSFIGGVRVATGDVNGDGIADIITAPGFGGGPVIRIWDGATGQMISQFNAYDPNFRGGVYVAVGDINGDGRYDIITGAGEGGGPHVKVFTVTGSGAAVTVSETASFMAYDPSFRGGVRVASADFNRDAFADIVTAPGLGGGPHVRIFDLQQPALGGGFGLVSEFMAFDSNFRGGIYVAAGNQDRGDVNGDGMPDIVVSMGQGGNQVAVYSGADFGLLFQFEGFAANTSGIRVGLLDANGDGRSDLVLGAGAGNFVRIVNLSANQMDLEFFAPYGRFQGGTFVAGA